MAVRKDTSLALAKLTLAIDHRLPDVAGPRTDWTFGRVTFEPCAPSVIPGRADFPSSLVM